MQRGPKVVAIRTIWSFSVSRSKLLFSSFISTNSHAFQFQKNPSLKMFSTTGSKTQFWGWMRWRGRKAPMTKSQILETWTESQHVLAPAGCENSQSEVCTMTWSHLDMCWLPKKWKLNLEVIQLPRILQKTPGTGRGHVMSMSLMVLSLLHPPIYAQWEILQTMKTFSPNQLRSQREKKGNTGLEGKCPHMPVSLFLPLAIHTYVDAIFRLPLAEPIIISDSDGNRSSHK